MAEFFLVLIKFSFDLNSADVGAAAAAGSFTSSASAFNICKNLANGAGLKIPVKYSPR